MRRPKLLTNYKHLTDVELALLGEHSLIGLRDNSNFPNLDPPFEEYEIIVKNYLSKLGIASAGGSIRETSEKNEARNALLTAMRKITTYINNTTELASNQLSSGFHPASSPKSISAPPPCSWSRIRLSRRPDEILLDFPAIKEAYDYEFQIADEIDENGQHLWKPAGTNSSSRSNFYAPVKMDTIYYFRVRARNKKGVSDWSPVSTIRTMLSE